MARTNSVVTLTYRNKAWNGTQNNNALGSYNAWMEEHINAEKISSLYGGSVAFLEHARGTGIIFEDINLANIALTYNNKVYEVLKYAKFLDYKGNVHHVEFIYG